MISHQGINWFLEFTNLDLVPKHLVVFMEFFNLNSSLTVSRDHVTTATGRARLSSRLPPDWTLTPPILIGMTDIHDYLNLERRERERSKWEEREEWMGEKLGR